MSKQLKEEILSLVRKYSTNRHALNRPGWSEEKSRWTDGENVPYSGRVFEEDEVVAAVESTLEFWLTLGHNGEKLEEELTTYLGTRGCLLVNSGSSANLIAIATLTSPKIPINKRLSKNDEVITVAAGFPTTVAPISQVGAIPVFVDADVTTGNVCTDQLEEAFTEGKTKAVMLAHALGIPFNLEKVLDFCRRHDLWLIEDNCDALGSTYSMPKEKALELGFSEDSPNVKKISGYITRYTGTWGDISTQSFYPPHHITMGEGGAINFTKGNFLKKISESFRDWGRDCWCPSGKDNTCNKRFDWQLGELPEGYDHKYIYTHLGYNLKPLDTQAAIGRVQLKRLPDFVAARKRNWIRLRDGLACTENVFNFSLPTHALSYLGNGEYEWDSTGCKSDCSWFGFAISIKDGAKFTRTELAQHLEKKNIGNRMLFGGNLTKQPAFVHLKNENPESIRIIEPLSGSNYIMEKTLFIGVYPGLTEKMVQYMIDTIKDFVVSHD